MSAQSDYAKEMLAVANRDIDDLLIMLYAKSSDTPARELSDETLGEKAQKAVEKAFKAVLLLHGVKVQKSHNLVFLAQGLSDLKLNPPSIPELGTLTDYAISFDYCWAGEKSKISRERLKEIVLAVRKWAEGEFRAS